MKENNHGAMLAGPQSNPVVPQKSTEHAPDIDMEQRECSSLMESGCTGEIHAQRKRMREGNDSEDEESDVNNYESSESEDYGYSSDNENSSSEDSDGPSE